MQHTTTPCRCCASCLTTEAVSSHRSGEKEGSESEYTALLYLNGQGEEPYNLAGGETVTATSHLIKKKVHPSGEGNEAV